MPFTPSPEDRLFLERCVELAERALDAGDDPFGSVLVSADGGVLAEAVNRETTDADPTAHPELELARWAIAHLTPAARAGAVVYTSGEPGPLGAAAHGWAGLGRIVFAASSRQLAEWRAEWGLPPGPVAVRPIAEITPGVPVEGPVPPYDLVMRDLHDRARLRPGLAE